MWIKQAVPMALLSLVSAGAQTFEVASVKPTTPLPRGAFSPPLIRGGPGSTSPGSATIQNVDLFTIVAMAYDVKLFQLSAPDWLHNSRFDIVAKLPAGATVAQYRLMLQALLADRFKLTLHHEQKESQVYELEVGKNGPKLKASADVPVVSENGLQPPATSLAPVGYNGPRNMRLKGQTLTTLADLLSGQLGQPVIDVTGLPGNYDIDLKWTGLQTERGTNELPTLFEAVQQQLGLKLAPKKGSMDILVIDRVEKVPTEN
jgi:uncharacterized protein (TIGR03435 family)